MIRNLTNRIIITALILVVALWVDFSNKVTLINPVTDETLFTQDLTPRSWRK